MWLWTALSARADESPHAAPPHPPTLPQEYHALIRADDLAAAQRLLASGCPLDASAMELAASLGRIGFMDWLADNGCQIDRRAACLAAVRGRSLAALVWLCDVAGCDVDAEVTAAAHDIGDTGTLAWIDEKRARRVASGDTISSARARRSPPEGRPGGAAAAEWLTRFDRNIEAEEFQLALALSRAQQGSDGDGDDALLEFNAFRYATNRNYIDNGRVDRAAQEIEEDHWLRCQMLAHRSFNDPDDGTPPQHEIKYK